MTSVYQKAVIIDGDKSMFQSKAAIERFKRDLKYNDEVKLATNNYFKDGITYELTSTTDTEIKVRLVQNVKEKVLSTDDKRTALRNKLQALSNRRKQQEPISHIKSKLQDKVPSDLLDAYVTLKREVTGIYSIPNNSTSFSPDQAVNLSIPPPDEVINRPDQHRATVNTMVQSFGTFSATNNPIVNYYKLLAKYLGLPTTSVTQPAGKPPQSEPANAFTDGLRKQQSDAVLTEVDDEMSKIYESLGIKTETPTGGQVEAQDDEMAQIYKSLGISAQ